MRPYRLALVGGLLYGLPLGLWLLGVLAPTPEGQDLTAEATSIQIAQLAATVLLLPALVSDSPAAGPVLLLAGIPAPLLVVPWLAGTDGARLIAGEVAVFAAALIAALLFRLVGLLARGHDPLKASVLGGILQFAALGGLLSLGPELVAVGSR